MKKLLATTAILAALLAPACADTVSVLDPLHGYDVINGVDTQTTNGSISPLGAGDHFGFIVDPADQTGDFLLAILVPTNLAPLVTVGVTGTSSGTGAFRGIWSSGTLESFIGVPGGSPNNPIGAFNTGEDLADPTASAFAVYTIDLGTLTLLHTLAGDPMNLSILNLPAGTLIAGFLVQGGSTIDTAPSSVLMVNAQAVTTPLPASLPFFLAGLAGLYGFAKRKKGQEVG